MNKESHDSQNSGPAYEDNLPLEWQVFKNRFTADELVLINNSNEEILKVIFSLDESPLEKEDTQDILGQHVMRIDAKMNFLMDMVGQLLLNSMTVPPHRDISIRSTGMDWFDEQALTVDDYIHIKLYLKVKYPKPIILPATVKSVVQQNGHFKISCEFEQLSNNVEDWLEKLIFRHHRRIVALARKA